MNHSNEHVLALEKRVETLESTIAFLQHDLDAQNQTILIHTEKIKSLEQSINRMTLQIEQLQADKGPRSLADEKPPHY